MNDQIILLDPSIENNEGKISSNLGDCIIQESVVAILENIFPNTEIVRVSLHTPILAEQRKMINEARLTFVGGSNVLTSNVMHPDFTRVLPGKNFFSIIRPKFHNLVLMGTGWCAYQRRPGPVTIRYYRKVLHPQYSHSVRDAYSEKRLKQAFISKVLDTGCPTIWQLNPYTNTFDFKKKSTVFTLTDYHRNPKADSEIIRLLLHFETGDIYFFPQGEKDLEYIKTLDIFKKNEKRIKLLAHDLIEYKSLIRSDLNYIGTRLHGGIACMQHNKPTAIIGIDNRAIEMGKDFQLPVVRRDDLKQLEKWFQGSLVFPDIEIPHERIGKWVKQFKK